MEIYKKEYRRREFISFLGKITVGAMIVPPFLLGCGNSGKPITTEGLSKEQLEKLRNLVLESLEASDKDDLLLAKGLDYHTIIKWGDKISDKDTFGFNNDFTCFIPLDESNPKDGLLWVNHEYINPLFVSNFNYQDNSNPPKPPAPARILSGGIYEPPARRSNFSHPGAGARARTSAHLCESRCLREPPGSCGRSAKSPSRLWRRSLAQCRWLSNGNFG